MELIRLGQLKRARANVTSKGCSDPTLPHTMDQIRAKFPKRKCNIPPPTDEQFGNARAMLDIGILTKKISALKPRVAPGLGGLRNEHLNSLIFNERSNASPKAKIAIEKLHEVGYHIEVGNLPWYFHVTWTTTGLAAVNKRELEELEADELMDCRPVAKGNTFRKVFTATLLEPFKQSIIDVTAPTQFGSGEKAGGSQLVFAVQLMTYHFI